MLFAISMHAQKGEKQKAYSSDELRRFKELKKKSDLVFNDNDPDFKVTDVPAGWKGESAVVLCQKYYYNYDYTASGVMGGKFIATKELIRRRIKLFDRAAVDAFSEFYFMKSNATAFRIIKPDGSSIDVDPKKAIDVLAGVTVPRFYRSLHYHTAYKKIAIPDLEPGDIIDYFYESSEMTLLEEQKHINYVPVIFTLSGTYPVLKQKYAFIVDKHFFINFRSFNGAPELKQSESALISDDKVSKKAKAYVLEDGNREKSKEERWTNEYLNDPMIKFQVYYVADQNDSYDFLGKSTEVRSEIVSGEEVRNVVMKYVKSNSAYSVVSDKVSSWINDHNEKVTGAVDKALLSYYYWRYYYEYKEYDKFTATTKPVSGPGDRDFICTMVEIMKELDILNKTEIVALVPHNIGNINTLLLLSELELGIRVGGDKGVILFPFERHSRHDEISYLYQGQEAYCFSADVKTDAAPVRRITIPASTYESNSMVADFNIRLSEDMELLEIKRTSYYKGLLKEPYCEMTLMASDYHDSDRKLFDPDYTEIPKWVNKDAAAEYKNEKEEERAEFEKEQKEKLEKVLKNDFEVESYDQFRLMKKGRGQTDSILSYEETFKLKGMVNKAGRNYSLDVGKLIGSQIKITDDEMKRSHDIYYNFPKKLVNNISIELPKGYVPDNMQVLEVNVENEAGTFNAVAVYESGTITITTTKIYKTSFATMDKWPLWVSFLDAAYNFSQKKLILKKT